jgi:transposase
MPRAASISDRSGNAREVVRRARLLLERAVTAAELRAAQAVLFVDDYGLSLQQTAEMMGCSIPTVGRLRRWLKTIPPNVQALHAQWGGRRRQNFSFAEEKKFLHTFKNQDRDGQGIAVKSIWQAYEAMLGRSVPDSTIYRLLHRHGWHSATRGAYHGKATPAARRTLPSASGRTHPSTRRTRPIESS